ncbi:type I polyketide synthase [Actinacidiphila yeochonensis]|uniref:type I polyketide synthase n=1 Tax=Actinacidiphila yeochonensis TaxID=89050 RepID=UPI00055D0265|nr:type I polyketide synthase [Actinacidiphila yeochonensis]
MSTQRIAVVGVACRYPDADSPDEFWRNILAGRRAFRRMPEERTSLDDYYAADPAAPDRFNTLKAAVLEGFSFDRVKYRVAGSTFRSTDMTHWLALDTAARALEDAGFPGGEGLPRRSTGVVVGNSLAGEFTRAGLTRLRWPYVRRTVSAALREQGWDDAALAAFLPQLEERFKEPFPAPNEDTLAGGLANTIAGRICNHFDLNGGGYTVDGACSSSLLSVATACNALAGGAVDAALAGGVDLSLDPFELIGFAKTGALATEEMRVYDRRSHGFWPGEGCGMLVLMRDEDAVAEGRFRYATIAGWGMSSDGRGGITRPEAEGHRLALRRAYGMAGFGFDSVRYLEGHGTGTAVGDATELRALSEERRATGPDAGPAAISSVKANIGHTKAAAGVAGLIKAILAVRHQVIPPATGGLQPHPELTGPDRALRLAESAELWPAGEPIRAGVSAMGFGGINAHVVVEHADGVRKTSVGKVTRALVRSRQDTEVLLLDAASPEELRERAESAAALCDRLSLAELADLAASLQQELAGRPVRAAVVAATPEAAATRLRALSALVAGGARSALDPVGGVFLGSGSARPRIGFLFPGQGTGRSADGGALRRRFETVDALYGSLRMPAGEDLVATAVAQPRIVASSAAGLRMLELLGIEAAGAAGHSLGELTALHWAGAMDEEALLRTAADRGRLMAQESAGGGAMAGVAADSDTVRALLDGEPVVIAGYNSPAQTVVSGPAEAVDRVCARAAGQGLVTTRLAVSHAFHSPAVAPASTALRAHLDGTAFGALERRVFSTVTGGTIPDGTAVPDLLARQMVEPVRFTEAVSGLADEVDLLLEVGPGRVLSGLAREIAPALPAISLDTDSDSLAGLLNAVAAAFALGAPVRHAALFEGRFTRPMPLDRTFSFLENPCESAPRDTVAALPAGPGTAPVPRPAPLQAPVPSSVPAPRSAVADTAGESTAPDGESTVDLLRRLAAERAELPLDAVTPDSNPVDELHLSSITVGQIVNQAVRELGLSAPVATTAYATSTLTELAAMLDELGETAGDDDASRAGVAGVGPWVRAFSVDLVPAEPEPAAAVAGPGGEWELFTGGEHPLAEELRRALGRAGLGGGVLLFLPRDCDERHVGVMLAAARAALGRIAPEGTRFVVVGDRRGAAGLAKSLHLEAPSVATTVVVVPLPAAPPDPGWAAALAERITADVAATAGFSEVHYDAAGGRAVPVLRPLPVAAREGARALGPDDVLLVTGGGKGITAECALSLARGTGAAVALLGRSDPAEDAELAANLDRMTAAGLRFRYLRADVTAADAVKAAVEEVKAHFGPVTAVLHGAGRNQPHALTALDEGAFRATLAPKIGGLEAVLAAADPAALRLLVTFGSIIGRAGLRGEADYSVANDWLTDLTLRTQEEFPGLRCLALEWSVWSGAGMGERLGVLESLMREGISPIPADQGIAFLEQLLCDPSVPTSTVVMGRAEGLPTITLEQRELPLRRFTERVRVHYPEVELVADADLSAASDPYLADHLLDGDLLFPAVIGMEAMAQAGEALLPGRGTPVLEDMEFVRPIVVPVDGSTTVRVAVLAEDGGTVRAVVRSSETAFQADHFRAVLRYGAATDEPATAADGTAAEGGRVPVDPATQLYGPVLFQGARFQRLLGYRALEAKGCTAEISTRPSAPWFSGYLPAGLVLADPGTRDALMHSLQSCVPDATLLPSAVDRLTLADPERAAAAEQVLLRARERSRDGDSYVYDLDVLDPEGRPLERWEGLRLQAVRKQDGSGPWVPALLGPFLERRTPVVLPAELRCAVHPDGAADGTPDGPGDASGGGTASRRGATERALRVALGDPAAVVRYRPDGRPEVDGALTVSASHGAGVTLAVAGAGRVACDVEPAAHRSDRDWAGLLGADGLALARLLAAERGEDLSLAATRVWGAVECLRKAGEARADLALGGAADTGPDSGGWVLLRSGNARIATFATALNGVAEPVVLSLMAAADR